MIGTIGALVQESSNRWRWLLSVSLYTIACLSTAMLLGAVLGALGHLLGEGVRGAAIDVAFPYLTAWLIAFLSLAYAVSDVGLLRLPRPTLMKAVPLSWWRWWRPYGAALAYGAALGLGFTTRIHFGAFYILCIWCFLKGDIIYGTLLMGTYGAVRALVLFPVSWRLSSQQTPIADWCTSPLFNLWRAQKILAVALSMFGTLVLASTLWH